MFLIFSLLVIQIEKVDITEQMLNYILQLDDPLEKMHKTVVEIKDSTYTIYKKIFIIVNGIVF